MKILALTDIHGSYKKAGEIISKVHADVVIIGGDLTTVGSVKEAEDAVRYFQSLSDRVLCVAGNMDLPQHDEMFTRIGVSINGRGVVVGDVGFFGASASPVSPLHTPYEIPEEELARSIGLGYAQVAHCPIKVFVPHAPPYGTRVDIIHAGYHVGSTAVRDFIEEDHPDVVICGHIHEARGQDTLGRTRIVNCGPAGSGFYASVEIDKSIIVRNHEFRSG